MKAAQCGRMLSSLPRADGNSMKGWMPSRGGESSRSEPWWILFHHLY